MPGKLIKFPRRRVVDHYDYELERRNILEKLALTPKKVVVTGLAGLVAGFLIQQNKSTLNEVSPYGQLAVGAMANMFFYVGKDLYFMRVTGKHSGHSINLETDLKYLGVFNAAGVLGYLVGNVKDLIT